MWSASKTLSHAGLNAGNVMSASKKKANPANIIPMKADCNPEPTRMPISVDTEEIRANPQKVLAVTIKSTSTITSDSRFVNF